VEFIRSARSQSEQKEIQKKVESFADHEPVHLEPVDAVPKAQLKAEASTKVHSHVVLDLEGTVTSVEPDLDVVFSPEGSASSAIKLYDKKQKLIYGLFTPDKAGKYRIALIAFGTSKPADTVRSYAFVDIDVVESSKPLEPKPPPGPLPAPPGPEPPLPVPTPQPKQVDLYGMYAYTKDLLAKMPTEDNWQSRVPLIYECFDRLIGKSANFNSATALVQATSDCYKSALGKDYNYFSYYFFTPLKTHLGEINSSGKLPSTVDAHVQAWKEISKALHEVKIPASTSRTR
jgi:hypothetical protein